MFSRNPLSEIQINGVADPHEGKSVKPDIQSPTLSEEQYNEYKSLLAKGRACAAEGQLDEALKAYQTAHKIKPTEKIASRITKIEGVLKEVAEDESNDDFVQLDNGLIIFRELVERLYPHQIEGIKWIYNLQKNKKKGGILADDMGLGKTIQVISVLSAMFDMEVIRNVLLVLPLSLIPNWEREFEKWAPGIKVKQFYGSVRERSKALEYCQRKPSVCLTTYGLVQTKWEQLGQTKLRKEFVWDYIILDEGHKIKNPTKTTKGLHAIPSRNRLILTGTPIQNNLRELWALFDWVMQGTLLGTQKTFRTEYELPITRARQRGASAGEIHLGNYMAESLRKIVDPFILRRTKGSVTAPKSDTNPVDKNQADVGLNHQPSFPKLERKNDFVVWTFLSSIQEEIYRDFLNQDSVKELLASKRSPLVYLTILKKICDHPRLLPRRACHQLGLQANESLHEEDFHTEAGKECAANRIDNISDETLIEESGKLQFLLELLKRLKEEGHRTLIFSLSRKMLNILHRILKNRHVKVMRLDGTISKLSEREQRVKRFQQDSSYEVFLLTTQVGGVGLTLTAADRVVIYDPSWNPATDAQAVDRIYRIGQEKNVVVYRLITCGTVEEKIYRRQIFKDSIIKQSTGDNKDPYRYFTNHELKELFQLEDTRESVTQQQLNELHSEQRCLDPKLDEHLAYLHSLPMFGVSDHDLMFSTDPDDVDPDVMEEHRDMIQSKVVQAHNRIQQEATTNQDTELRWGGFDTEPKSRSPRPYKEKEPVYAIEGLYDKMDSLKVEDDAVENSFNRSKTSISSTNHQNDNVICLDSDDEQISEDRGEKSMSPHSGSDAPILAADSPEKQSSEKGAESGNFEIGESFVSDFDLDESAPGLSTDPGNMEWVNEHQAKAPSQNDQSFVGNSDVTNELTRTRNNVENEDLEPQKRKNGFHQNSLNNSPRVNDSEGDSDQEPGLDKNFDDNLLIKDDIDPWDVDDGFQGHADNENDLDENIDNSSIISEDEMDKNSSEIYEAEESEAQMMEARSPQSKSPAKLNTSHASLTSHSPVLNRSIPNRQSQHLNLNTDIPSASRQSPLPRSLDRSLNRTGNVTRGESSMGNLYFSGSSETSRNNTPDNSRPQTPFLEDDSSRIIEMDSVTNEGGFIRSDNNHSELDSENDDEDLDEQLDSENDLDGEDDTDDANLTRDSQKSTDSCFQFSPLNRDERISVNRSMNQSLGLNYEDSPLDGRKKRLKKKSRQSTALRQPVISDSEEEESSTQYRETTEMNSSNGEEEETGEYSLNLSCDSEEY